MLSAGSRHIDDFRESYKWLSENTPEVSSYYFRSPVWNLGYSTYRAEYRNPLTQSVLRGISTVVLPESNPSEYTVIIESSVQDAKVLSWWDYGYHLSSMANRTTYADGNTWNNTHISRFARFPSLNFEFQGRREIQNLEKRSSQDRAGAGVERVARVRDSGGAGRRLRPRVLWRLRRLPARRSALFWVLNVRGSRAEVP